MLFPLDFLIFCTFPQTKTVVKTVTKSVTKNKQFFKKDQS